MRWWKMLGFFGLLARVWSFGVVLGEGLGYEMWRPSSERVSSKIIEVHSIAATAEIFLLQGIEISVRRGDQRHRGAWISVE